MATLENSVACDGGKTRGDWISAIDTPEICVVYWRVVRGVPAILKTT